MYVVSANQLLVLVFNTLGDVVSGQMLKQQTGPG
jgi:hypothetical protein